MHGPGEVIDNRFRLEREIARGGSSRVWRARDELEDDALVALKIVTCVDEEAARRFQREVSVHGRVSHPGIVRLLAHGTISNVERYLALQWVDGISLAVRLRASEPQPDLETMRVDMTTREDMIEGHDVPYEEVDATTTPEGRTLSLADTFRLGRRIALALDELHTSGWVHRDVKPGNILLPEGNVGEAVLVDLGTARKVDSAISEEEAITLGGILVGTPLYMSPEQASATGKISAASDVWSLGCVIFRALTGRTPFEGGPVLAVLARILTDDPACPLLDLRPDLPEEVAILVSGMLAKDPEQRPRDGAEAHAALAELERKYGDRSTEHPAPFVRREIGARERRARCVLVAKSDGAQGHGLERVSRIVGNTVDEIHRLADGSVVIRVMRDPTALDRARRAAYAALALRAAIPSLRFALATERLDDAVAEDVVTRAAQLLDVASTGQIELDAGTAELLDLHFVVQRDDDVEPRFTLLSARSLDGARPLLGRPTPWVGRKRELEQIIALFEECREEPLARAVLVIGEPGIGKSRLRGEVSRRLRERASSQELLTLYAQGDSLGAGAPFAMLAAALREACGIHERDPVDESSARLRAHVARPELRLSTADADRVAAMLGEIAGMPAHEDAHPALRAVRRDPLLMNTFAVGAWLDWLDAETRLRPVAIMLDDLHWGDTPTLRFVDAALEKLKERPLFVFALARPEVKTVFPNLWRDRSVQEIQLEGLSRKAATQLVRGVLGDRVREDAVESIVDRSAGNAFFLEELIRSTAESNGRSIRPSEPPSTVLAVLHTRLKALGDGAKRVLCAASIFGEIFTAAGVRAIVGDPVQAFRVTEWLENLVEREILTRHSSATQSVGDEDDDAFKFRHALVRDAAYDLLTRDDRTAAHLAAATWLEQTSFVEPLMLAEQFVRGGEPKRAVRWFCRAAEQALEGRDLDAVHLHAERGVAAGAGREEEATLRWLQAVAAYWQSRYADAARFARSTLEATDSGSRRWFLAMAELVVSSARLADFRTVEARFHEASSTSAGEGAEAAKLVCLCRSTFQMIFHGRFSTSDAMLERIDELATDEAIARFDPLTAAQIHHVRGVRAAHAGSVSTFLQHLERAVEAFERGSDRNNVLLERTTIGWCWAEIGDFKKAESLIRANLAQCTDVGAQQAITYAKVNLGFALLHLRGKTVEARRLLDQAMTECRAVGNARLEGWAAAHASTVAMGAGVADDPSSPREALRLAEEAVRLLSSAPSLLGWAEACRSRALLACGDADGALSAAQRAHGILQELGGMLQGEALPPLVLSEALEAKGRRAEAVAAILDASARLERRVSRLAKAEWRDLFRAIPDNARTLKLAATLR